jgi:hypothetical protein
MNRIFITLIAALLYTTPIVAHEHETKGIHADVHATGSGKVMTEQRKTPVVNSKGKMPSQKTGDLNDKGASEYFYKDRSG